MNADLSIYRSFFRHSNKFWLILKAFLLGFTSLWIASFPQLVVAFDRIDISEPASQWVTQAVNIERLEQGFFFSKLAKSRVSYHIYKPESYETETKRRFPVIYWLHGVGGGLKGLSKVAKYFDLAIQQNKIPPVLIVFPYGMNVSLWSDSKDGSIPMESVILRELLPHIDATFRTVPERKSRMVEGYSMGGYGAARFGFKYPEIFGAISMIAAGPLQQELVAADGPAQNAQLRMNVLRTVFGNDQGYFKSTSPWKLVERNAHLLRNKTILRILVGERDQLLQANIRFSEYIDHLGISHEFRIVPGVDHNALAVYQGIGEANWAFYRSFFKDKL
ncbi:MAG: hypothetical protein QG599_2062 [Pseudomonadota bacterium]|nr:hypothetical protein [Pseudomonadota bacterium]